MNYKCMTLAVLLLPISCYSKGNEARIKELKEAQFKKILELEDLAKKMCSAAEFIYCGVDYFDSEKITPKNEAENKIIVEDLNHVFCGNTSSFNYDLLEELFDKNRHYDIGSFDTYKCLCIRAATEQYLLRILVMKYQECLYELIKINQELKKL